MGEAETQLVTYVQKRMRIWSKATGAVEAVTSRENPGTVEAIWNALPVKGSVNRWGDEIYFSLPVKIKHEQAKTEMEVGSIAYAPRISALCIFFGPTPASEHAEPRAYSPVNAFAKIVGDPTVFKKVRDGDEIIVEKLAD